MGNGVVSIPTPKTKGKLLFNKLMTTVSDINSPEFLKMKINVLQEDLVHVKEELMTKEHEVQELQREVNKLKTVLLQSNNYNPHSSCDTITPFHEIRSEDFTTLAQKRKILQKSYSIATANKKIGVSSESSEFLGQNCNVKITRYEKDFRSKQLIKEAIQQNDFLAKLDASQVREVVDSMHPMEFQEGSYVIKEGSEGDHLYVAADGEYDVIKDGVSIGRIGPGEVFGEMAILYNCTRTASVKAMMDCSVWVLERRIFQHIMVKTGLQRLHDNITFLKSIQLLHSLPNDILAKIADVFKIEFYYGGDYVVKHGLPGDTFFIINTGRVKVIRRSSITKEESELKILNKGDYFGEQANMKENFQSLSIIAMSPGVECVTLDKESFNNLIGDVDELHEKSYALENKMSSGNLSQISDDSGLAKSSSESMLYPGRLIKGGAKMIGQIRHISHVFQKIYH